MSRSAISKLIAIIVIMVIAVVGVAAYILYMPTPLTPTPTSVPSPTPGPAPPPPPPPIYILAEITVEATVLDVNKTFVSHHEGYTGAIPLPPPYPTPTPPPPPTNITACDVYEIIVALRVDSIVKYKSEIEDLLKPGDQIIMKGTWLSPHYVNGVLVERPDLRRGDRIRFTLTLCSIYEKINPLEPNSYWWAWSYPEIEVISTGR